jgi:ABC-type multidrug transport system ATPase subunit
MCGGVKDFSLKVALGILRLLGPNGAGKSSFMNILATITRPTEGSVFWNGVDIVHKPDGLRRVLGYLPQSFGVYPNLNAQEFIKYGGNQRPGRTWRRPPPPRSARVIDPDKA